VNAAKKLVRAGLVIAIGFVVVLIAGAVAIAWLYGSQFGGKSTFVVANRTTIAVIVPISGSTLVVAPCSDRTIGWNLRWGADPQGKPVTEPVPSGAWVLPAQYLPLEPFEGAAHRQVVITDRGVAAGGNTQVSCQGLPPVSQ
jgi:hypothetical protein